MMNTDYVLRKEGERGPANIQESTDALKQRLNDHIKKRGARLISATRNNTDNTSINRTKITRKQKCEEKQVYGHFSDKQVKSHTSKLEHG